MALSLNDLIQSGGFCGAPVMREITWSVGGVERTDVVYIRRLSYASMMSDLAAKSAQQEIAAARIAACVCDETGKPIFSVHDVTGIGPDGLPIMTTDANGNQVERGALIDSLTLALFAAISDVNGLGKQTAS